MKTKSLVTKKLLYQILPLGKQPQLLVQQVGDGWGVVTRVRILLWFGGGCNKDRLLAVAGEHLSIYGFVGVKLYSSYGGSLIEAEKNRKMRERIEEQRQKYQRWIDGYYKEDE